VKGSRFRRVKGASRRGERGHREKDVCYERITTLHSRKKGKKKNRQQKENPPTGRRGEDESSEQAKKALRVRKEFRGESKKRSGHRLGGPARKVFYQILRLPWEAKMLL